MDIPYPLQKDRMSCKISLSEDRTFCKIGHSKDVKERIGNLKYEYGCTIIDVISIIPCCDISEEIDMHKLIKSMYPQ